MAPMKLYFKRSTYHPIASASPSPMRWLGSYPGKRFAFKKAEAGPLRGGHATLDFLQIAPVSGSNVVQPDRPSAEQQQSLQQVAADETGYPGNQPRSRYLGDALA
jgi:hypothetical protein